MAVATKETLWLYKVPKNYDIFKLEKILIFEDKQKTIVIVKN